MFEWTPQTQNLMLILALVWTLPWKGVALWRAARNGHLIWFIALLLINTLGILEILYIFVFGKSKTETKTQNSMEA